MAFESGTQVEVEGRRRRAKVGWALVVLVASCSPPPAAKAEADLATIRKESDAATLIERGKGFAAVGDNTRAEEYLASGIEAGADPREVLPLLMDVCVKTGRYRSAIQHGENHLRKHPHDVRTRLTVGTLYVAISESKQARVQLEQVIDKRDAEKLHAEAHYLLGVVARDADSDVVVADRHFREYLRLEPNGRHAEEAKAALLTQMPAVDGGPHVSVGSAQPQKATPEPTQTDGGPSLVPTPTRLPETPTLQQTKPEGGAP